MKEKVMQQNASANPDTCILYNYNTDNLSKINLFLFQKMRTKNVFCFRIWKAVNNKILTASENLQCDSILTSAWKANQ